MHYIDKSFKDPSDRAEADAEDAERTKGTPGYPVDRNRPSRQREDPRGGESSKAPPDRSLRPCLSRVVPADYEARCQVKDREDSCKSEGTGRKASQERRYRRIQKCSDARVQGREREKVIRTREMK